jgi:hypothetical protein
MLATVLMSHAGDDAARATWPRHDIDAESYWRWCCRVNLAMVLSGPLGRNVMYMLSHDGNDIPGAIVP